MAEPTEIVLRFEAPEELQREIAQNLEHGRAFYPEPLEVEPRSVVTLVLQAPAAEHRLLAEVVMVASEGPARGVGLALTAMDAAAREALAGFAATAFGDAVGPTPVRAIPSDLPDLDLADEEDAQGEQDSAQGRNAPLRGAASSSRPPAGSQDRQQRLRKLTLPQQVKLARSGELGDRVVLERITGKPVWDALLRNPRITVAEIARLARKGTVPKHLLEQIVDNAAWTKTSLVRRALLSNPKLGSDLVMRVLKFAPRHELRAMLKNTAYPQLVRSTARKLVNG